mgnify:CR=1 FL=1
MQQAVTSGNLWSSLQAEAHKLAQDEPIFASYFNTTILRHESLCSALSFLLASKLDSISIPAMVVREVIEEAMADTHSGILRCMPVGRRIYVLRINHCGERRSLAGSSYSGCTEFTARLRLKEHARPGLQ